MEDSISSSKQLSDSINDIHIVDIKDYEKDHKCLTFTYEPFKNKFYLVKNCLVMNHKNGQIILPSISKDKTIILNQSFSPQNDNNARQSCIFQNFYNFSKDNTTIKVKTAIALNHIWSNNFWHWILECLPKVLALEDKNYKGSYIVPNSKFVKELLELIQVDRSRIITHNGNIFVESLVIPPMYSGYELINHQHIVHYIRNKLLDCIDKPSNYERVYIKRTGTRHILNEQEIIDILNKHDFFIMVPEEYSVKEQISNMVNAKISVMAHGANSTLTLFQQKNSTFIEFFSSGYIVYHTIAFTKALGINYIPIPEAKAEPIVLQDSIRPQYLNITAPTAVFSIILENCLKR